MKRNIKDTILYVSLIAYVILSVPVLVIWGPSGFWTLTLTETAIALLLGCLYGIEHHENMAKMGSLLRELETEQIIAKIRAKISG